MHYAKCLYNYTRMTPESSQFLQLFLGMSRITPPYAQCIRRTRSSTYFSRRRPYAILMHDLVLHIAILPVYSTEPHKPVFCQVFFIVVWSLLWCQWSGTELNSALFIPISQFNASVAFRKDFVSRRRGFKKCYVSRVTSTVDLSAVSESKINAYKRIFTSGIYRLLTIAVLLGRRFINPRL